MPVKQDTLEGAYARYSSTLAALKSDSPARMERKTTAALTAFAALILKGILESEEAEVLYHSGHRIFRGIVNGPEIHLVHLPSDEQYSSGGQKRAATMLRDEARQQRLTSDYALILVHYNFHDHVPDNDDLGKIAPHSPPPDDGREWHYAVGQNGIPGQPYHPGYASRGQESTYSSYFRLLRPQDLVKANLASTPEEQPIMRFLNAVTAPLRASESTTTALRRFSAEVIQSVRTYAASRRTGSRG